MKATFVFERDPQSDDPEYRKWHLQDSGKDWQSAASEVAEVLREAISSMSDEEAIRYLDYLGRPYRRVDSSTVEITISD